MKKQGIIAAGHPATTQAGRDILDIGGNAFDAALAAMLASCVAEVCTTSAGGGGFLLGYSEKSKRSRLFDFFSQTPRQKRNTKQLDFFPVQLQLGAAAQTFHIGMASVAIPGFIKGWLHIHKRLGSLPISEITVPAKKLAREGIIVSPYQASSFKMLAPIYTYETTGQEIFCKKGTTQLIESGARYKMEQFADALEWMEREGERPFYEGEIAQQIVKDCQERGGHLSMADFKHFEVIERNPLTFQYRDHQILTNPPPCSGGLLIAFALSLLKDYNFDSKDFNTKEHLELLAEVMRQTNVARKEKLDAFIYDELLSQQFLAPEFIESYQKKLPPKRGCTTHISVLDAEGNAASVTTSMGEGCGYWIPGTQIMLNNMLGEEDLNPNGFHTWKENSRLSSMMSPTITLDADQQVSIVTGTGGANRIRTAIFQVLHNIIDLNMSVQEAVRVPRVHFEHDQLFLEPGFIEEIYKIKQFGEVTSWEEVHHFFGGAHSIYRNKAGVLSGAGDPRRDGVAI